LIAHSYYLSIDRPYGNIKDSVNFVLDNFVEMNKLWVRLQHQGHSRDRDMREQERRELRLLVGSNLVRLSQLEEITLEVYQDQILPKILDEIVGCKDAIAQEYLLDVIIQAFPDQFHLQCLDMYLSAISGLNPSVNIKTLVISLIDRFASYAARIKEEKATSGTNSTEISEDTELFNIFWDQINELIQVTFNH
jgi:vacuolar protein sorting-associated protein 35